MWHRGNPLFSLSAVPGAWPSENQLLLVSEVDMPKLWAANLIKRCMTREMLGGYYRSLTGSGCITGTLQLFDPAIGWTAACLVQDRVMSRKAVDEHSPDRGVAGPLRTGLIPSGYCGGRRPCTVGAAETLTPPIRMVAGRTHLGRGCRPGFPPEDQRAQVSSARDENARVDSGSGILPRGPWNFT
jgi:hypothetical protein